MEGLPLRYGLLEWTKGNWGLAKSKSQRVVTGTLTALPRDCQHRTPTPHPFFWISSSRGQLILLALLRHTQ